MNRQKRIISSQFLSTYKLRQAQHQNQFSLHLRVKQMARVRQLPTQCRVRGSLQQKRNHRLHLILMMGLSWNLKIQSHSICSSTVRLIESHLKAVMLDFSKQTRLRQRNGDHRMLKSQFQTQWICQYRFLSSQATNVLVRQYLRSQREQTVDLKVQFSSDWAIMSKLSSTISSSSS